MATAEIIAALPHLRKPPGENREAFLLAEIRNTICQVYAESAGSPYYAGVVGKPLPTPLFYRFKLAGGYAETKSGYRRVMVADLKQERIRAELDERIGTLLQKPDRGKYTPSVGQHQARNCPT